MRNLVLQSNIQEGHYEQIHREVLWRSIPYDTAQLSAFCLVPFSLSSFTLIIYTKKKKTFSFDFLLIITIFISSISLYVM